MTKVRARPQSRTRETEQLYRARAEGKLTTLASEMGLPQDSVPHPADVIAYLRRNAQNWKWSAFRQYQASFAFYYAAEFERTGDPLYQETANEIRSLPWHHCKPNNVVGGTSSRKRKGVPERDFNILVANLSTPERGGKWAPLAARWLQSALATGLRPCEWESARLVDGDTAVEVDSAKATNGRGNGGQRRIPIPPEDVTVIRAHLSALRELLQAGYSFDQIHKRTSEALRRVCRQLWRGDPTRRYALYSARHQFSANSKAQYPQEKVAELLGHSSIKTARRHYAPKRAAWARWRDGQQPRPQPMKQEV